MPTLLTSVSTGVWCVPRFGVGFDFALESSKLQKESENPGKGHFCFLRQTLVCTEPWFKRDPTLYRFCIGGVIGIEASPQPRAFQDLALTPCTSPTSGGAPEVAATESPHQKGLDVCYCLWGAPSRPSPGCGPGPVQVLSRVRRGPIQIRHVRCFSFSAFRTHPGGSHPGPSWSHPGPERSFQDRAWTGRNRLLGPFRLQKLPWVLFCPTFCAKSSGPILVDFYRFSLPSPGQFGQFSPDFSQL